MRPVEWVRGLNVPYTDAWSAIIDKTFYIFLEGLKNKEPHPYPYPTTISVHLTYPTKRELIYFQGRQLCQNFFRGCTLKENSLLLLGAKSFLLAFAGRQIGSHKSCPHRTKLRKIYQVYTVALSISISY